MRVAAPSPRGRPPLPPTSPATAHAAVRVQHGRGNWATASPGGTSEIDHYAVRAKSKYSVDEEAGLPAPSAAPSRPLRSGSSGGGGNSTSRPTNSGGSGGTSRTPQGLSNRAKWAISAAILVLVAAAATAIAVGVTQGKKSSGSSSGGDSGDLNGGSVGSLAAPPPPAPAVSPPPPTRSPPAVLLPPIRPAPRQSPPPPSPSPPPPSPPPLSPPPPSPPPPTTAPPPPSPVPPSPPPPSTPFPVPEGSVAIFWDEFDGSSLDSDVWGFDLGAPTSAVDAGQMQVYTDSEQNARLEGGQLLISARKEGSSYTSARIRSKQSWFPGMQLPGGTTARSVHLEARIQMPPPGQGLWAALWLQPTVERYGGWPQSGEIDVVGCINSMTNATSGLHYGAQYPQNVIADAFSQLPGRQPFSDSPHVFALDWEIDTITISVDGVPSKQFVSQKLNSQGWFTASPGASQQAPFDAPFNVILNVAVGGDWPGPPNVVTPFPATMAVDYVRVWAAPNPA